MRHHGAGRVGGGAGHRGGIRGDIGVRSLQELHGALGRQGGGRLDDRVRRPAGRRDAPAAARCASGIDPHPELLRAWGLPDDADGLRRFATICVEAFAGVRGGQAAGGVLRAATASAGYRGAGAAPSPRCATPACWCWPTPSAATSARRWPPTRACLGRRLAAGRRRGHRLALPRLRLAAAAAGPRRRHRARGVRAGPHLQPGGRARAAGPSAGGSHRGPVDRRRGRAAEQRAAPSRSARSGVVVGATVGDRRAATSATLNGPVLVPGVGAQGGTRRDLARRLRGRAARCAAHAPAGEVLAEGPDLGRAAGRPPSGPPAAVRGGGRSRPDRAVRPTPRCRRRTASRLGIGALPIPGVPPAGAVRSVPGRRRPVAVQSIRGLR